MMQEFDRPRVAVTGLGLVSPLGNTVESSWERMVAGQIGISSLQTPFRYQGEDRIFVAGQVQHFSQDIINPKQARRTDTSALYSLAATFEALNQAGLWQDGRLVNVKPDQIGAKIGTGFGGAINVVDVYNALKTDTNLQRLYALVVEPERVATVPSMAFNLKNSASSAVAACATGGINLLEGYNKIVLGQAEVIVAGSSEAVLRPETYAIYDQARALSRNEDPNFASTPFDKDRSGFVVAEGAGILVLENMNHAQARGANVLAELVGVAESSDAFNETAPSGEGAVRAMRKALQMADLQPSDVDYINAHGTGTSLGDKIELSSIETVFGPHALNIPISSVKWQFGHMIGAAASAEAVAVVQMINQGLIIPNVGLRTPLRDDLYLPKEFLKQEVNIAMKNSFGFGGINSVMLLKKFNG